MRFIRNEIQSPKRFLTSKERKNIPFYFLLIGITLFFVGAAGFFLAFILRDTINKYWANSYRDMQTLGLYFAAAGLVVYWVSAAILRIPLKKTTFYKLGAILKDKPYDPRRKGDFTKLIYARLMELDDKWALFTQVNPPKTGFIIPQVIVGPGGIFTNYPLTSHPDQKYFKDPGPLLIKASKKLGDAIGQAVTPIIIFSTNKLVQIYRKKRDPKTGTFYILELEGYFKKRKNKLTEKERLRVEKLVFDMIKGIAPGE